MNRSIARAVTLALALFVACVSAGCAGAGGTATKTVAPGESVTLSVGQQMEIALASNPTTGYSWQVADDAGGIVSQVGEPEFIRDAGPAVVGRGGAERFTFEARKRGSGTLVLEYRRPWEKNVAAEKTVEVSIVVQ